MRSHLFSFGGRERGGEESGFFLKNCSHHVLINVPQVLNVFPSPTMLFSKFPMCSQTRGVPIPTKEVFAHACSIKLSLKIAQLPLSANGCSSSGCSLHLGKANRQIYFQKFKKFKNSNSGCSLLLGKGNQQIYFQNSNKLKLK